MSILDYIEKIKRENEGPRITAQEPRTMLAKAGIPDAFSPDLEQTEVLRPGETLEQWEPNPFLKPHAEGGRIGLKPGGIVEPGVMYYGKKVKELPTGQKRINLVQSLVDEHNASDKFLYDKESIYKKLGVKKLMREESVTNVKIFKILDTLDPIETKIHNAFDKIIDEDLKLYKPKGLSKHTSKYGLIKQMISDIVRPKKGSLRYNVGARAINEALNSHPRYQEIKDVVDYLDKYHATDFKGKNFSEAFEYSKWRRGGLNIKNMVSYTTGFTKPESSIFNSAIRHAYLNYKDGAPSDVKFFKLKPNGTKGELIDFNKLPKDTDGSQILDTNKVGFEYKKQFFSKNNLKTDGFKSGLFDEVYDLSRKGKTLVPDPANLKNKITLKELLQRTGDHLTIGHDDAAGGVRKLPFNNLKIQGGKLNIALFHAYDKIKNKDLRKLVLNELELIVPKGKDYETAFIEGKVKEARKAITTTDTLYRGAGKKVIEQAGTDILKWGPKKQTEALRIAGIDLSKPEGRLKFRQIGTAKILNKILENNKIKICNDKLSNGKGVVCGTKFAERDPNAFLEAIKRNKDAAKIINKPGLVKGALKGLSGWAKKELGPMGWLGSIATIDSAFGLHALGQGKTPLQALDTTLWFLPKSVLKADEKMFKNVYEKAGYTEEDAGEFQKWTRLEDLDQQYFMSQKQLKFMQGQILEPEKKSAADIAYQKEVDAIPDMYKNMGWMYPKLTISSEQEKTGKHPFYGPAVDRHNKILTESTDVYESLKDPEKSWKDLDYTRKLAAMEQANRKKKLMRASLKYNPDLIPLFDPFSKLGPKEMKDQSFLYDEYVHPIEGPSVSPEQIAAVGKGRFRAQLFADGGLTRTVAPESGPMDQGLPSLYNNVRKR